MDEFALIRKLAQHLPPVPSDVVVGIGDDAAVVKPLAESLVFSTDTMVEGVHFLSTTLTPHNLGYKSLVVSLSDIAAMGGRPLYALVSLAVGAGLAKAQLEEVYAGFREVTERFGCHVVGGDTVRTDGPTVMTTTVIGEVETPILRSGAKPGDILFVTGRLGGSSAGLEVQKHSSVAISPASAAILAQHHQRPVPRIAIGQLCVSAGVHALNDISDGLASELNELAEASHVRCIIDEEAVPVVPEVVEWAKCIARCPVEYALYGGEDYELVGAASRHGYAKLLATAGMLRVPITRIGEVTDGDGVVMRRRSGNLEVLEAKGYNHFQ